MKQTETDLIEKVNYLESKIKKKEALIERLEQIINHLESKMSRMEGEFSYFRENGNRLYLMEMINMFKKRKGYLSSDYFELYMKISVCIEERLKLKDFNSKHDVIIETIEELENEYTSLKEAIEKIKETSGLIKLQKITRGVLKKYGG